MVIKCRECGASVSDQSFVCPNCGRDVRSLRSNGAHCYNCMSYYSCDREWGPDGYVCLHWYPDDGD